LYLPPPPPPPCYALVKKKKKKKEARTEKREGTWLNVKTPPVVGNAM